MTTCPYCGTNYIRFQPNCSNCGAPLQPPAEADLPASSLDLLAYPPPLPPRPIADRYVWKLLWSDGWAVFAIIDIVISLVFLFTGAMLSIAVVTAFVGIPFAILGGLSLIASGAIFAWRYQVKSRIVQVLREGQAVQGEIVSITVNRSMQVNGANPWTIGYRFRLQGMEYFGKVTTLNPPGGSIREGLPAWVLYLPGTPEANAMYPHP
jgi:hypothetical protein